MRQALLASAAVIWGVCGISGCNQATGDAAGANQPGIGGVAVIDLDEVARRLGRDVDIKDSLKHQENSLNEQLASLQSSYADRLDVKRREIGEAPSPEQTQQLAAIERQINLHLRQVKDKAQQSLNQHRSVAVNEFRDQVRPYAQDIATTRGLSIVVPKNDTLLFAFDTAVDITDEVVAKMLATPPPASQARSAAPPAASPSAEVPRVPRTASNAAPHQH